MGSAHNVFIFVQTAMVAERLAEAFLQSASDVDCPILYDAPLGQGMTVGKWAAITLTTETASYRIHLIVPSKEMILRYMAYDFEWLVSNPQGAIIIVDSADPTQFRETKALIETYRAFKGSYSSKVIAGNQDHLDAWSVADLYTAFRLDSNGVINIVPCDSNDTASVRDVILTLLEQILDAYRL